MPDYDFSSLRQPVTADDIRKITPSRTVAWHRFAAWALIGVTVSCFMLSLAVAMSLDAGSRPQSVATVVLAFGFMAAILGLVRVAIRSRNRYLAAVNRFALQNGATFRFDTVPVDQQGMIFDEGRDRTIKEVLKLPDGVEIGNYTYVTGNGKNQQTHSWGYVRIALNTHLPNMVLDAKGSNFLGITNLPDVYHSSQKLRLEGDFNDYFDLYAPKEYERDALYVFTPDVMQAMIEGGRKYDMEIIDDELYMYSPAPIALNKEDSLRQILSAVATIASELRDQTRRYSDERVEPAQAHRYVAQEGRRLKKGVNWILLAIVAGVIGFYMISGLLPQELTLVIYAIGGGLFWAYVIFLFLRTLRQHR